MKKSLLLSLLFFAASLLMVSCDDDDDMNGGDETTDDIVGVLQSNGFTSLVAAATQAELADELQGTGPLTVFAPTNAAFDALLSSLDVELADIAQGDLVEILT